MPVRHRMYSLEVVLGKIEVRRGETKVKMGTLKFRPVDRTMEDLLEGEVGG